MSQILDDLKENFKKIDQFYSSKLKKPIENFVKSSKEVSIQILDKISCKLKGKDSDCTLLKDNAHIGESIINEDVASEVKNPEMLHVVYGVDGNDITRHSESDLI